ncbi:MAG: N-acetylmuramoyl-L-alanine amidase [Saprospiraceae bacterium]|nr:N-acetylmuramoyl-L-alanine amidase [Saprospiraceae bacterium]
MRTSPDILKLLLLFLLPIQSLQSQKTDWQKNYLTAIAQPGDNVLGLLSRYGLADFDCNISMFCKINNLEQKSKLKPENSYKLPICVAAYNGKSIRSSLGIEDWKAAKRIESFNKTAQQEGLRPESFIDNKRLWVPAHELECPEEAEIKTVVASKTKPTTEAKPSAAIVGLHGEMSLSKGTRNFSIFGKAYAQTPLVDQRLKGRVFYLISGHGGPDVGAQGKRAGNTLCEDEYAYDVTLRLLRLLLSHGATAYMVVRDPNDGIRDDAYLKCDKDEVVWGNLTIPLDQKERLLQRTDFINQMTEKHLKAGVTDQTIVEIHVDSRSHDTKTDVFFYYRPESDASKAVAEKLHQTFLNKYLRLRGQRGYNGTVSSRSLLTLKETTAPKAVYIELANIKNDWDQQRLVLKNNRQAVANWLFQGLLK